ncbi:MAG TPA: hypothetical protein EYP10_04985 [Armatimonadetes bacterium]|nr:hypothetical protein [Armatimonadota bacterium]
MTSAVMHVVIITTQVVQLVVFVITAMHSALNSACIYPNLCSSVSDDVMAVQVLRFFIVQSFDATGFL